VRVPYAGLQLQQDWQGQRRRLAARPCKGGVATHACRCRPRTLQRAARCPAPGSPPAAAPAACWCLSLWGSARHWRAIPLPLDRQGGSGLWPTAHVSASLTAALRRGIHPDRAAADTEAGERLLSLRCQWGCEMSRFTGIAPARCGAPRQRFSSSTHRALSRCSGSTRLKLSHSCHCLGRSLLLLCSLCRGCPAISAAATSAWWLAGLCALDSSLRTPMSSHGRPGAGAQQLLPLAPTPRRPPATPPRCADIDPSRTACLHLRPLILDKMDNSGLVFFSMLLHTIQKHVKHIFDPHTHDQTNTSPAAGHGPRVLSPSRALVNWAETRRLMFTASACWCGTAPCNPQTCATRVLS
jgi:hypothetical protein